MVYRFHQSPGFSRCNRKQTINISIEGTGYTTGMLITGYPVARSSGGAGDDKNTLQQKAATIIIVLLGERTRAYILHTGQQLHTDLVFHGCESSATVGLLRDGPSGRRIAQT